MPSDPVSIGPSPKEPIITRSSGYYRVLTNTKSAIVRKKMRPI
jgi:hypothetical protein